MFKNCLICTNLTDGLDRLVKFVPYLAGSGVKRIVFLHNISVWESEKATKVDEDRINRAQERLAPALQEIPEGIEVKVEVLSGQPKDTILRLINTYNINVVFTGMSIRSAVETKIFGSNTLELAPLTPVPLMVFRPQLILTYTQEELALRCQHLWRSLLIPYNGEKSAQYLIEQIKHYAQNRPKDSFQQCVLLWVIDDGGRTETLKEYHLHEAQEKLNAVKTELEALNLTVETKIAQGNPLHEILDTAVAFDISAIAIAHDYSSNILQWTISSLAKEVVSHSWFPVLFFSLKQ
ncbi:UspA domain protein [Rippkaea orientalis PCC 8801]|uniref:UspA domain protein n=1 Tax=Rippkaea orientalis (strain PCC 8801 / RF-1) TaxID=41431 RepID=B7K063_RIPO1|nr:universal stress protein [Rippkaea orientalis]ACK66210.1 UspA domain protein [Rippkaea orientalis PCC 8801]